MNSVSSGAQQFGHRVAAYLDAVHFIPLPPHTWELSYTQIQSIK